MKTILVAMTTLVVMADPVMFQGRSYRLGSFSQKAKAMWAFVSAPETVADMYRLAQGVLDTYKARGAKVVMARTMQDAAGKPFNYMACGVR